MTSTGASKNISLQLMSRRVTLPYRNPIVVNTQKNAFALVTAYKIYTLSLAPDGNGDAKNVREIWTILHPRSTTVNE